MPNREKARGLTRRMASTILALPACTATVLMVVVDAWSESAASEKASGIRLPEPGISISFFFCVLSIGGFSLNRKKGR